MSRSATVAEPAPGSGTVPARNAPGQRSETVEVGYIFGLMLLSYGANLLIFMQAGVVRGRPPLIEAGQKTLETPHADPLPQALVLTAIVISFGMTALVVILALGSYLNSGTDVIDIS